MKDHKLLHKLASDALKIETINFVEMFKLHGKPIANQFNYQHSKRIHIFYKMNNKLIDQLIELYVDEKETKVLRFYNSTKQDLSFCTQYLSKQLARPIYFEYSF